MISLAMKRQCEGMEDERASTRQQKIEDAPVGLPVEVLHLIMQYSCYNNERFATVLLQSAKLFEDLLDEQTWKLLYRFRWPEKIAANNSEDDNSLDGSIAKFLSTTHSEYVKERFYDKSCIWRNIYKARSKLVMDYGKESELHPASSMLNHSLVLYKSHNEFSLEHMNFDYEVTYGNTDKIEEHNRREILAIYACRKEFDFQYDDEDETPFGEDCIVYQAVVFGATKVPVKFRVETITDEDREWQGIIHKKYYNMRILAYNEKHGVWNVIVAQFSNYAIEEDEVNYYQPYFNDVMKALFGHLFEKSDGEQYWMIREMFGIITAAADVPKKFKNSNTSCYVTLN